MFAVTSCNFGQDQDDEEAPPQPAPTTTVVPEATTAPATAVAMATEPEATAQPSTVPASSTPLPTQAVAEQPSSPPTTLPDTPTAPPTFTPAPSATSTPFEIVPPAATNTPVEYVAPAVTNTPFEIVTPAATNTPGGIPPTATDTPMGIITAPPTWTPDFTPRPVVTIAPTFTITGVAPGSNAFPPPPTFTPSYPQATAIAAAYNAQVCNTCGNLRLRSEPGTAGNIVTHMAANTPLNIIGKTEDNVWVQVTLLDGRTGWVASRYLDLSIDLNVVSVTGTAVDVPTQAAVVAPVSNSVVSGVSSHARQIFLDGLAKGNAPHTFVRVGDSISAAAYYLTAIGTGNYSLGEYGHLAGAISFFSGPNGRGLNPFTAPSMAAQNGWGTTSALDPNNANPSLCHPGETPLECEYRVSKPAVALIMFGTNDSGGLPTADFRANLQRIVQISIDMGVIPVLSTIPPKHYDPRTDGRVPEFNQVIIALARANDIPLWDYHQAMSQLPGEGLSADGVHPNTPPDNGNAIFDAEHLKYGYTVRNLGALQVLYALWQQVLYDADTALPATLPPQPTTAPPGSQPVDPNTYTCPGTLPVRLAVGAQGRVTPGLPNKIRNAPQLDAEQVGNVPGEAAFTVIGGPHCADGFTWWQIDYQGTTGWTASGNNEEYWVEPLP